MIGMNVKLRKKPIPSSLRHKHRYLLIQLLPLGRLSLGEREFEKAIESHFSKFFGLKGIALNGFQLMHVNSGDLTAVIKCFNGFEDEIKAGLLLFNEVNSVKVVPFTLKASGSLKALAKR